MITRKKAKLGQQALQTGRELSGWVSGVLGDFPRDLFGYAIGDRIKAWRWENAHKILAEAVERLRAQGIEPAAPNPRVFVPLLEAAADEGSEELQALWARLLAAAVDPNRKNAVRQSFIQTLKDMDPLDALLLEVVWETGAANPPPNWREFARSKLDCSTIEVEVSFEHLEALKCFAFNDIDIGKVNPLLTAYGKLLMEALSG